MSRWLVLIVGAADTGRAPMAAALLGRLVARESLDWRVASAGVVGHDGDRAEPEARSAMLALGLDIEAHRARSLTPELAATAAALVAVERGIVRVLQAREPAIAAVTLGDLAGRARDIPDPFRMQLGAWLQYASEIEALLRAGLPRLRARVEGEGADTAAPTVADQPAGVATPDPERLAAITRVGRLLALAADMPGVLDWNTAGAQLAADLNALAAPQSPADLAPAYVALVAATLGADQGPPPVARARVLVAAVQRLRAPITPPDLEALAAALGS